MRFELSFDDGSATDMRLADLLDRYGFKATFYMPSNCALEDSEIKELAERGHTIGGHTLSHPHDMKLLNNFALDWEINGNRLWLRDLLQREVFKFAYPRGRYDDRVIDAVKNAGFTEARTTLMKGVSDPIDPFRLHTTIQIYPRPEYEPNGWFKAAKEKLEQAIEVDGYFHLWSHSADLERFSYWHDFRDFLVFCDDHLSSNRH